MKKKNLNGGIENKMVEYLNDTDIDFWGIDDTVYDAEDDEEEEK